MKKILQLISLFIIALGLNACKPSVQDSINECKQAIHNFTDETKTLSLERIKQLSENEKNSLLFNMAFNHMKDHTQACMVATKKSKEYLTPLLFSQIANILNFINLRAL